MQSYKLCEERVSREGNFVKLTQVYQCESQDGARTLFAKLSQHASRFWATIQKKTVDHKENEVFYAR